MCTLPKVRSLLYLILHFAGNYENFGNSELHENPPVSWTLSAGHEPQVEHPVEDQAQI